MPRILMGVHFFALERPIIKSKGRTLRTMVRTRVCVNTGRVVCDSRHIRQEIVCV